MDPSHLWHAIAYWILSQPINQPVVAQSTSVCSKKVMGRNDEIMY